MTVLLTIAGFDPSSGAGATADLAVFAAHGFFGTSCLTALTVQSTLGVRRMEAVGSETIRETLECLEADLPAGGIKIGMLGSSGAVEAVADFLAARGSRAPVILDTVIRASSGRELLEAAGVFAMRRRLLPLVDWITPNLAELGVLVGKRVGSRGEMEAAAAELQSEFPGLGVVVTGGHLDADGETVADLVMGVGGQREWIEGERIMSRATHGTGCAFSSAMLCGLVSGLGGGAAARAAKEYVTGAIRHAEALGSGAGPMAFDWMRGASRRPR